MAYVATFAVELPVVLKVTEPEIVGVTERSDPKNPDIVELNVGKEDPYVIDALLVVIVSIALEMVQGMLVVVPKT